MASEPTSSPENAPAEPARLLGFGRWPLLLAAGAAILLLGAFLAGFLLREGEPAPPRIRGEDLLAALAQGDLDAAGKMAERFAETKPRNIGDRTAMRYVLGITQSHKAGRLRGVGRTKLYREAAENLAHAGEFGFSPGHEDEGLYHLGVALLESGQAEASREPLRAALERRQTGKAGLHLLLAEACRREPKPEPKQALAHIDQYLNSQKLTPQAYDQATLLRAEILMQLRDGDACRQAIAPLLASPKTRAAATLLEQRLKIEEARQLQETGNLTNRAEDLAAASEKFQQAIGDLRKLMADAPRDHDASAAAMFLIGQCYLHLGDDRAALDQFARTSQRYLDTPEGWASLVEVGAIRLKMRDDPGAVQALSDALRINRQSGGANNRWISQEVFRGRLAEAVDTLLERNEFAEAVTLAESADPPFTKNGSLELQAKAYQAWGRKSLAEAADAPPAKAKTLRQDGRVRLRTAGELYHELALERFATKFYPDDRWNSVVCFFEAQNYPVAIYLVDEYLDRSGKNDRPRGLILLGKANLALADYEGAVKALRECAEFHTRHPAQFEARVILSQAYVELGEVDKAEASLKENLEGDLLTPSSREWRESQFALARLLHEVGRYGEAQKQLAAALARYPEDRQAVEARYLLADCHLQEAARFDARLRTERVEETRRALWTARDAAYASAEIEYGKALDDLARLGLDRELTRPERAMIDTAMYNRGASLAALGRYSQAIEVYTLAAGRTRQSPEALAAYVQVALCARRQNQPDEAETALALAGVLLDRLPADAPFAARSGFNRDTWSNYIAWLRTL